MVICAPNLQTSDISEMVRDRGVVLIDESHVM